jgi:hypothetical protein
MSLLTVLILQLCLTAPPAEEPTFEGRTFDQWKSVILPGAEERWLTIPWHTSLHQGLKVSGEQGRPMLLWLMNGHPLGCT